MPAAQASARSCSCRENALWAFGAILQEVLHAYLGVMKAELCGKVMGYEESDDASQRVTGHEHAHVGCLDRARIHDALHMLNYPPACQGRHTLWRLRRRTQHVPSACTSPEHCHTDFQAGNQQIYECICVARVGNLGLKDLVLFSGRVMRASSLPVEAVGSPGHEEAAVHERPRRQPPAAPLGRVGHSPRLLSAKHIQ